MAEASAPSAPTAKSKLDSPKAGDQKSPESSKVAEEKDLGPKEPVELVQTRLEGENGAEVMKVLDLEEKTDGLLHDHGDLISPLIKVTNGKVDAANGSGKMTLKANNDRLNSNSASPGSTSGMNRCFFLVFFCTFLCSVLFW